MPNCEMNATSANSFTKGSVTMLVGKYNHQLDAKNRFFVPAKYRDALGEKLLLVKNVDHCLSLFSEDEFLKFSAKIEAQPMIGQRKMRRDFFSNIWSVEIDSQGRIAIPDDYKLYAGLDRSIFILGCGSYAEIWSEEAYLLQQSMDEDDELLKMMLDAGL